MIPELLTLTTAFMLGLTGSAHCVGMCGGLASAFGMQAGGTNPNTTPGLIASTHPVTKLFAYNFGRISSYCLAGLIVGLIGLGLNQHWLGLTIMRYVAAFMLIAMGLYLTQWWYGLSKVEKAGQVIWKAIQPLGKKFLPINRGRDAFFVGMVWGWLPCGLVYSALTWSAAEPTLSASILVMLCFGLGTLPAMLGTGFFAQSIKNLISQRWFKTSTGLLMIIYGIATLPIVTKNIMPLLM